MPHQITADQDSVLRGLHKALPNPAFRLTNEQVQSMWDRESGKSIDARVSAEKLEATIKLYQSVARQVSEDQFIEWHASGELPLVALSPEQMESARGGTISGAMFVGFTLGTVLIGGGILIHAAMTK